MKMEKKMRKPFYLAISPTQFEGETEFGPSMVEPCNNLSLEQLVKDYSRGILHVELNGVYDDGDDIPEDMNEISDLTDLQLQNPFSPSRPDFKPKAPEDGTGKGAGAPASSGQVDDDDDNGGGEGN